MDGSWGATKQLLRVQTPPRKEGAGVIIVVKRLSMTKESLRNQPRTELLLFLKTMATSGKRLLMVFIQLPWKSLSQPASLLYV